MRGVFKAWLAYAAAGLVLVVLITIVAAALADTTARRAIVIAAVIAYVLQLVAFGLLLALRDKAHLFIAGWLGGMLLRFGALGACLFWASRTTALPRTPLVLSLVGFVFMLLLLEPVFLRWDLRGS
ncbi:MAG TPA: hypothetical protein VFO52_13925 [Longimicrobiales bacterium]|nr:hypothetical protein [Longimicrobiales bacterium]